jgi:carbon monoxide dehydrogenase subunit G
VKISDSLEVDFPIQQVWDLVQDPRRSMVAMPGVQSVDIRDDTTFDLIVAQRMGPFRVRFQVTMSLEEVTPPTRLVATGQGEESSGTLLRIPSAILELEALGDERTRLSYEIEFSLMGKLGTLGYPMLKHKAGEMSKKFADNLREELSKTAS